MSIARLIAEELNVRVPQVAAAVALLDDKATGSWAPDGSINLHFGYLNRNYVQEPAVPVGANNSIQPGGPDRGQPTFFYSRTQRNMFTVNVPKDWDRKREVIWTVTVNGKTERAVGWLQARAQRVRVRSA